MPSFMNDTSIELTDRLVNSSGMEEAGDNDPNAFDIFIVTIRFVINFFGLLANGLVVFVVYTFGNKKTYSNKLEASLAIAENLVLFHDLVLTLPAFIVKTSYTAMVSCVGYNFGNVLTVGIGFHLAVIAFDRFLKVNFPFKYSNILQKTPLLLICWIPGILIGLGIEILACHRGKFVGDRFNVIIRCVVFGALTLSILLLYTIMLKSALHHKRAEADQLELARRSSLFNPNAQAGSELDSIGHQNKAVFIYIGLGVSTFISLVLPMVWLPVAHSLLNKYDGNPPEFVIIVHQVFGVFMSVNSAVNPIIYSFNQRLFRDKLSYFMSRIRRYGSDSLNPIGPRG